MTEAIERGTLGINEKEIFLVREGSHVGGPEVTRDLPSEPVKVEEEGNLGFPIVGSGDVEEVFAGQPVVLEGQVEGPSRILRVVGPGDCRFIRSR